MSIAPNTATRFDFTQGDRMKRSMKVANVTRAEIAEYLGVAPETVSTLDE